ncbi:MAG: HAD family hydrolase [Alphaproteobacteria bacterium]
MNSLAKPRAILFDWDNTLVDSWPAIHAAMAETQRAMGQAAWTLAETRANVRRSLRDAFPDMFGDRWTDARDIFYKTFLAVHLDLLEARAGAAEMLARLNDAGLYLGVVSNKTGDYLRREASHLGWSRYFGRLVGATDAAADKPSVAPVDLALSGSGVARGTDVWFVGDTAIDIECARNAGLAAILMGDLPPDAPEFARQAPDMVLKSCPDLVILVLGQHDPYVYKRDTGG